VELTLCPRDPQRAVRQRRQQVQNLSVQRVGIRVERPDPGQATPPLGQSRLGQTLATVRREAVGGGSGTNGECVSDPFKSTTSTNPSTGARPVSTFSTCSRAALRAAAGLAAGLRPLLMPLRDFVPPGPAAAARPAEPDPTANEREGGRRIARGREARRRTTRPMGSRFVRDARRSVARDPAPRSSAGRCSRGRRRPVVPPFPNPGASRQVSPDVAASREGNGVASRSEAVKYTAARLANARP
jgi:hypothetical protein